MALRLRPSSAPLSSAAARAVRWDAHHSWPHPAAQRGGRYVNFLKNLSIMGGALYVFVAGAGRYAVDAALARR